MARRVAFQHPQHAGCPASRPHRLHRCTGPDHLGELKDRIERCAAYLRRIGIAPGDVVTIQLPNRIAFPIAFFALELIGAVANKVNPDFRIRELDYILRFSGSKAFICPGSFRGFDHLGMARQLRAGIPALTHVVVSGQDVNDEFNLEHGIAATEPLPASERVRMSADDIFRMAFTSGTTGNPKCVLHSFNTTLPAVRQINRRHAGDRTDVQLVYLPVCLNWGYLCLLQAIVSGSQAVLLERFSAKAALDLIQREGVTYIATAPASIVAMLNEPNLSATTSHPCGSSSPAALRPPSRPSATTRRACPVI